MPSEDISQRGFRYFSKGDVAIHLTAMSTWVSSEVEFIKGFVDGKEAHAPNVVYGAEGTELGVQIITTPGKIMVDVAVPEDLAPIRKQVTDQGLPLQKYVDSYEEAMDIVVEFFTRVCPASAIKRDYYEYLD